MGKKGLLLCVCQGDCPSFHEMNIFEVGNAIRRDKLVDYVAVHPQLCARDGDEFLKTLLSNAEGSEETEALYVAACDPTMQIKMYRDAFEAVGFESDKLHGVDIRNMNTDEAVGAIKTLIAESTA